MGLASAAGEISVGAAGASGAGEAGGFTVSAAVRVTPPDAAEMVAPVAAVTGVVVTVKLALLAPAGTVTLDGTAVAAELSESVTTAPPLGATALRDTRPVEDAPPATLVGLRLSAESVGAGSGGGADGPTVIAANWNTPLRPADS